jgi:hypothetical protein
MTKPVPPPVRPTPVLKPTPAATQPVKPAPYTPAYTPQANKPVPTAPRLDPSTNQVLLGAQSKVGPKTKDALNAVLAGQMLTDAQRGYLLGALEKNISLSPAQKAAIATALQQDSKTKLQLAAANAGNGSNGGNGNGGGGGGGGCGESGGGYGGGEGSPGGGQGGCGGGATPAPAAPAPAPEPEPSAPAPAPEAPAPTPAPETEAPPTEAAPEATSQTVRYLRVSNQTGEALRVHVQMPGEDRVTFWDLQAGQTAYLAVDGVRVTASEVFIWAQSATKAWNQNKTTPLPLGTFPYQLDHIGTHTHVFRP